MGLKTTAACVWIILITSLYANAAAQPGSIHYGLPNPPRLFPQGGEGGGEPFLVLGPDYQKKWDGWEYYYSYDFPEPAGRRADIEAGGNVTMAITGVQDMIYNPEITILINIMTVGSWFGSDAELTIRLRCDGDGDGHFEYMVDFGSNPVSFRGGTMLISPEEIGEPVAMTNGTMELYMERTDPETRSFAINCDFETYLEGPFDYDTDSDGTGDFSDLDDDNDGVNDRDDPFPLDPDEWRDADHDGIGDNADDDDNGNNIPDDIEIPLAMGIVLIPLVVIMAVMNRIKKKKKKDEGEFGEEDTVKFTTPHEGPKNW